MRNMDRRRFLHLASAGAAAGLGTLPAAALISFVTANVAQQLESQGDAEIVQLLMAVLRQGYGPLIPNPVDFQRSRWGLDPLLLRLLSAQAAGLHER